MKFCAAMLLFLPLSLAAQRGGEARTSFSGRTLTFDLPGLLIGTAEYDEGPTGVTVFHFPARAMAAVDVRGGAPGTVNTDALRLGYGPQMSAIVFAGGSWHGLAAVSGVADEIRARRMEAGEAARIVGVTGAIINDLGAGSGMRRFSIVTPDAQLGAAALRTARAGQFYLGPRGAGRFAMTGGALGQREFSGQGGAFREFGPTKIAVFTVVNSFGVVVDRGGRVVRCRSMHRGEACGTISDMLATRIDTLTARARETTSTPRESEAGASENTTLTIVVTNQKLEWWALQRLAAQVHTSMARAIQPFATTGDGDVPYAVTTAEIDNPRMSVGDLTLAASELAWDAVLSSVPEADPAPATSTIALDPKTLDAYAGDYDFGTGARISVKRDGTRLVAESTRGGQYFPDGRAVALLPIGSDQFVIDTWRRDRIRFERNAGGRLTGITLNPGQWALPARRMERAR